MPDLENLRLEFDLDAVLRGQGADPSVLRARRPALVQLAEQALQEGLSLIEPLVSYKEYTVKAIQHDRMIFNEGGFLTGKLPVQHLAKAQVIYVVLCSIGSSLERYSSEMWDSSATYSLALDGVGSAAVEALANAVCRNLEDKAAEHGWKSSIPLSPGMIDWSVMEGQPQIFSLLESEDLSVKLSEGFIMTPRKSLTMVLGAGLDLITQGSTCDYCNLRDVCRYREKFALDSKN